MILFLSHRKPVVAISSVACCENILKNLLHMSPYSKNMRGGTALRGGGAKLNPVLHERNTGYETTVLLSFLTSKNVDNMHVKLRTYHNIQCAHKCTVYTYFSQKQLQPKMKSRETYNNVLYTK